MTDDAGAKRVVIGRVAGVFGLRGEVKVATSDRAEYRPGLAVTARLPDGNERVLAIESMRMHGARLVIRFSGVDDADGAASLRGATLTAAIADLPPLAAGTYRDEDLLGMHVVDARLGDLGEVRDVKHYPHADMLVVGERSVMVPMLEVYGVKIDADARAISTALPDGFEEL